MRQIASVLLLCCVLFISACASSINNSGVKLGRLARQDHVVELLKFFEDYSNMTPEAQKKALNETNQVLATNKNDLIHRIRLAAMLALPTSRVRDMNKAQGLLLDLLQENNLNATDSALVSLLYEYTVFDNKQLQKYREESKKLDATQQKYDALEQKLNELKNIEKTMNERAVKTDSKP